MNIAEYRSLLVDAGKRLEKLGATVKKGGSEWCSFVEGMVSKRGVELYCSDDKKGITVDYFESGEALHGERDYRSLDLALASVSNWLTSGNLPS